MHGECEKESNQRIERPTLHIIMSFPCGEMYSIINDSGDITIIRSSALKLPWSRRSLGSYTQYIIL